MFYYYTPLETFHLFIYILHLISNSVSVLFALRASLNATAPSLENPLNDKFNVFRVQFV